MPLTDVSSYLCTSISVVLTPTLGYRWFKKNAGWQEEWKDLALRKIRQRWVADYKPKPRVLPRMFSATFPPDPPATSSNVCMLGFLITLSFRFAASFADY